VEEMHLITTKYFVDQIHGRVNVKGKVHPRTGHEEPEGD
jgi:hypothetical protein